MKKQNLPRRNFLKQTSASLAAVTIGNSPLMATTNTFDKPKNWTIQEVIDLIIQEIPGGKKEATVDTIKIGDANQKVKGIISTFMATVEVSNEIKIKCTSYGKIV